MPNFDIRSIGELKIQQIWLINAYTERFHVRFLEKWGKLQKIIVNWQYLIEF